MKKEDEALKAVVGSYDHNSDLKSKDEVFAQGDEEGCQLPNEDRQHKSSKLHKAGELSTSAISKAPPSCAALPISREDASNSTATNSTKCMSQNSCKQKKQQQLQQRKSAPPSKHGSCDGNCDYDSDGDATPFDADDGMPGAYHEGGSGSSTSTVPAAQHTTTIGGVSGSGGNGNTQVGLFSGGLGFGDPMTAAIAQTEVSATLSQPIDDAATSLPTSSRIARLRRALISFPFRRNLRNNEHMLQEHPDEYGTRAQIDGGADQGDGVSANENDIEQPNQSEELTPSADFTTASVVSQEEQRKYEELKQHTLKLERELTEKPPEAKVVKIEASHKQNGSDKKRQSRAYVTRTTSKVTKYQMLLFMFTLIVVLVVTISLFATKEETSKNPATQTTFEDRTSNDESFENNNSSNNTVPYMSTLERIYNRGHIICGEDIANPLAHSPGLDMCMALSAALFEGDSSRFEMEYDIPFYETFDAIQNSTIDISMSPIQPTISREIQDGGSLAFAVPAYYSGVTFGGIPEYVECAEKGDSLQGVCRDLSICVRQSTVQSHFVYDMLPGATFVEVDFVVDCFDRLQQGLANVMVAIPEGMPLELVRHEGYDGPFGLASRLFTRNSPTMTMRGLDHDIEFLDMVNWIFHSFVVAETMNITKDTSWKFPTTDLFGPGYEHMFQHALSVMGNYGEMYERYWEQWVPRNTTRINKPHTASSNESERGLLYPIDLGNIDEVPQDVTVSGDQNINVGPTMTRIGEEQVLRCGIVVGDDDIDARQTGLLSYWNDDTQQYEGSLHVAYCKALASALFTTTDDAAVKLQLVPFLTMDDGFVALATQDIDVLSGAIYNMANDIRHPVTQVGYNFSPTYFYYINDQDKELDVQQFTPLAMATRQNPEQAGDIQWSDFVKLVVNSIVYAEDVGITRSSANQMPLLELYGLQYRQALRDTILSVGNYAELYNQTLEMYVPRLSQKGSWNTLNNGSSPMHTAHSSSFNWK